MIEIKNFALSWNMDLCFYCSETVSRSWTHKFLNSYSLVFDKERFNGRISAI